MSLSHNPNTDTTHANRPEPTRWSESQLPAGSRCIYAWYRHRHTASPVQDTNITVVGEPEKPTAIKRDCVVGVNDKSRGSGQSRLVEAQRGNEKNKQPLPVPLWPEISNTLIPANVHRLIKERRAACPVPTRKQGQHRGIRFNSPLNSLN